MLTFEEKKELFDSFDLLTSQTVSMNRLNYHFEGSAVPKTTVIKYLHPKNGNAFIYAGYLPKEETKDGYISVKDATSDEIRELIEEAISFLKKTIDGYEDNYEEVWTDVRGDELRLRYSSPMWLVIMSSDAVEGVFKTKEQAEGYLLDEGFSD